MSSTQPLDWVEQIHPLVQELEEKPQFGQTPRFDWKLFEENLKQLFSASSLRLFHEVKGWQTDLKTGENFLSIECAPLEGSCLFFISHQDLKQLMAKLLGGEREASFFYKEGWLDDFYHYLTAELLYLLDSMQWLPTLNWRMKQKSETLKEQSYFVIAVTLSLDEMTFGAKIFLSDLFRKSLKRHLSQLPPAQNETAMGAISVFVGLEAGSTNLSLKEWKKVNVGDLIILDRCTIDPDSYEEAHVTLTLKGKPLFFGKLKKDHIKITSFANHLEEEDMARDYDIDDEDEDDEDLYGDFEDEDEDEDEEDEDEFEEEDEEDEFEEGYVKNKTVEKKNSAEEEKHLLSADEIPIKLTVEVGRVPMSVQELLNLSPGNLLDLKVAPEAGVDLLIEGKKVGRGELIRMGEALGVRILSI